MSGDQRGAPLERVEGGGQLRVALVGRDEERVVRRQLARRLPDALHRHELGRVRGEPVQLDQMPVLAEPADAVFIEAVTGRVVDDEEDLAALVATNKEPQELPERLAVEDVRELERELRGVERYSAEDVPGLAQAVRVDARLNADARPRAVQTAVLPEARFVLEDDYAAAASGLFLIAGSRFLSQNSCASLSARASRLRGRWTEKPSWCSSRGTWWLW